MKLPSDTSSALEAGRPNDTWPFVSRPSKQNDDSAQQNRTVPRFLQSTWLRVLPAQQCLLHFLSVPQNTSWGCCGEVRLTVCVADH